ncbi:MAG: DNA recombination protein RmuC [Bacteroidota bacterium]
MEGIWILLASLGGMLLGAGLSYMWMQGKWQLLARENTRLQTTNDTLNQQIEKKEADLREAKVAQIDYQSKVLDLTKEISRLEESHSLLQQQMKEKEGEMGKLQIQFRADFESLAQRILEKNTQKLSSDNQFQLHHLLQPLKERLSAFEQKVEHTYQQEARERFNLKREIEKLASLNLQMGEEARNLTRALKGDTKLQGNWGELVLERILEQSGLRSEQEYIVQGKGLNLKNENGQRLRPDVIICLPDKKHLIIDSKVSLVAYERYLQAESDGQQDKQLQTHLQSVMTHIDQLSQKHYSNLAGLDTPDFVLLFMPLEPAFSLALQAKADLFTYAWDKRIVLVSPTTLLATLRTVASLWKLEQQNTHALEIARQGGALYDKFVGFVEEMDKVGTNLDRATRSYADAMLKLRDGQGSLASRAEKLRALGIKNRKKLE